MDWKLTNLVIAYTVVITGMISVAISRPVIALVINSRLGSMLSVTLLTTLYMLPRALFSPMVGHLHDRGVSPRLIAGLGFGGFVLVLLGYMTFPPSPVIYVLKVAEGICGAVAWPGLQMVVLDESKGHKEMGNYFALGNAGAIGGYFILCMLSGDFLMVLFASVIFEAVSFVLVLFLVPSTRALSEKNSKPNLVPGHFDSPSYAIKGSIVVTAIAGFLKGLYLDFLSVYAAKVMAFGVTGMSLFLVGTRIVSVISAYTGPRGVDRNPVATLNILAFLVIAGSVMILFLNVLAIPGFLLLIGTVSLSTPITRSHLKYAKRGTGLKVGVINSLSNVASAMAPLYGYVYDTFYTTIQTPIGELVVPMLIIFAMGLLESWAIRHYLVRYHVGKNTGNAP